MRGIDRMLHVYKDANGTNAAKGTEPVEAAAVPEQSPEAIALARRRTDGLADPLDDEFGEPDSFVIADLDLGLDPDSVLSTGALVPSRLDDE